MFGPQIRAKANAGVSAGHMTVIMGKSKQSKIAPPGKKGPAGGGPFEFRSHQLPAVPAMMMPTAMPADFGRRGLRVFLDRSDGGGICQRQRLSLLHRRGEH